MDISYLSFPFYKDVGESWKFRGVNGFFGPRRDKNFLVEWEVVLSTLE